jgi:hypothetical protein
MPDKSKYNLDWRPGSYWDVPEAVFANIKGDFRRQQVKEAAEAGRIEEIPDEILRDTISDALRGAAGAIHPTYMGGEYLPDYEEGDEAEIARVTLDSTTRDVISVRACREGGRIAYRVVDEYDRSFTVSPESSELPLTLGELIALIDGVEWEGYQGLTTVFRDSCCDCEVSAEESANFVNVSSEFYPRLAAWYDEEAEEWLERVLGQDGDAAS